MKKFLIVLMLLACVVGTASALTYDQDNYVKNRQSLHAGRANDPVWNFIGEIDGMLDGTGTGTITNLLFDSSITSDPTSTEGRLYYNSSIKKFKFHNGTSFITMEAGSSGNSLDGAYDVGRSITVDAGSVILTGTDAADNVVLAVIQSDAGSTVAQTITSAGTGALLTFDSNGTGADILGSDSTWTITKAGAATLVGITNTGAQTTTADITVTGAAANWEFDVSRNSLHALDNAVLAIGGATTAVGDVTFSHDGTNFSLLSATADEAWLIGGTTNGFDITYAFETAGQIRTDYDADFLNFTDDMDLRFGTGGSSDGDFKISSDSANLLTIDVVVAGTGEIAVGNDADDVPVKWYAETASDWVYFNADEVEFEDVVLQMMDATQIQFGDSDDFFMHATNQAMTMGTLTSDETSAWNFGADTDGDDLKFFGATTAEYWLWDASADSILPVCGNALYTMTDAEADQFKVNATGVVAGDAINFETTDGGIMLNADGATNGDIELNSADDIILTTAGKLTITNGSEAMTVSGAVTIEGATGLNGAVLGDGGDSLYGFLREIEIEPGTAETLTAADSGKVFTNTAAQGNTVFTLPAAAAGITFSFVDGSTTAADDVQIQAVGDDTINGGTAAKIYECVTDAVGQTVTITALDATRWEVTAEKGTWANNNS